jgi:spore coat polysaccharide biosynthesis protein SpsF
MYNNYKVNAIVQARMTSSRLPGKVLLPLANKPVLQHIIERLRRSKYIDEVVIACTTNEADDAIIDLCNQLDCKYYRGSEDDVLTRVLEAAKAFDTDIIVEVTADCPMIDPTIADSLIEGLCDGYYHYASNVISRTYPRGFDTQVFWTVALDRINKEIDNPIDRQHVSTYFYRNPQTQGRFKTLNVLFARDRSDIRLTLDTEDDYNLLGKVFDLYGDENDFTFNNIIRLFEAVPSLKNTNSHIEQKSYEKELEAWYKENTKSC